MLGQVLSDPKTMDKLRSFFDGRKMPDPPQDAPPPPSEPPPDVAGALQNIDPKTVTRVLSVVQAMNSKGGDGRARLLYDLKPYISKERGRRVDEAAQILRLISALDLFREDGE